MKKLDEKKFTTTVINGEEVNVSNEELQKYGASTIEEYMEKKIENFNNPHDDTIGKNNIIKYESYFKQLEITGLKANDIKNLNKLKEKLSDPFIAQKVLYLTKEDANQIIAKLNNLVNYGSRANHITFISKAKKGIILGAMFFALSGCSGETKFIEENQSNQELSTNEPVVDEKTFEETTTKTAVQKILNEKLSFDPNDNYELVNRMTDFLQEAIENGIPVKEILTDEEKKVAEENGESIVSIEQLMDFYFVRNVKDIDPIDYARLGYKEKTATMIIDNYLYCCRIFQLDALTMSNDTKVEIRKIVANKEGASEIEKIVNYIAQYNSTEDKTERTSLEKEITEYIMSNYIERELELASYDKEYIYRMMYVLDMLSNSRIVPKDIAIILTEDGVYTCSKDNDVEDENANKSARSQEFSTLYSIIEEKLTAALLFYDQDLTNILPYELKNGQELETDIIEKLKERKVEYNPNPKDIVPDEIKNLKPKVTTDAEKSFTTTVINGEEINVSNEELQKYGASTIEEYMEKKKEAFDKQYKFTVNDKVISNTEINIDLYSSGYKAGYYDGQNGIAKKTDFSSSDYSKGYGIGYDDGQKDKQSIVVPPTTTNEVPIETPATTDKKETTESNGYTGEIAPVPQTDSNTNPVVVPEQSVVQPETQQPSTPVETQPEQTTTPVETPPTTTNEVPIETPATTDKKETIETIDYTSSITDIKNSYLKIRDGLNSLASQYDNRIEEIQKSAKV